MSPDFGVRPSVEQLLKAEDLTPREVYRDGPRYWVGRVARGEKRLLLKVLVNDEPWQRGDSGEWFWPADQLRTELRVTQSLSNHADELRGITPKLVAGGLEQPVWMLRELSTGQSMAAGESPLMYRPEFYDPELTEAVLAYIRDFQRLTPQIAEEADMAVRPPHTTLAAKIYDIDADHPTELWEDYAPAVRAYLMERQELYDANRGVLTHGQVFPPHIYWDGARMSMIDWENAALGNGLADLVAVWLRGFDNPGWQEAFRGRLRRHGWLAGPEDEELWRLEVLIQASGTLSYLFWSKFETPAQKTAAIASLRRQMRIALDNA